MWHSTDAHFPFPPISRGKVKTKREEEEEAFYLKPKFRPGLAGESAPLPAAIEEVREEEEKFGVGNSVREVVSHLLLPSAAS